MQELTALEAQALEVARELVAMGVPVFAAPPCPGESCPNGPCAVGFHLPKAWAGLAPRLGRLDQWRPGYALAAVCGHGLDVLDTDPRSGGMASRAALNGSAPVTYGLASTPSGGTHEWIASLGVHKGTLAPGLDLQSGAPDGTGRGFVFIPPTVRVGKTDGIARPYVWITPPTRPKAGDDSGAALRTMLAAKRVERVAAAADGERGQVGGLGEPIVEGTHDATLAAYAAKLATHGLGLEEIVTLVVQRGADCVPPWGGRPGDETLEHAARTRWVPSALRKFGREYEPPGPALTLVGAAPAAEPEPEPARPRFLDWREIADSPAQAVDWLVPGIIPARRGVVLYSATGVGKSLLTLELAVAVTCGGTVLGAQATQGVVLYVDHENDPRGDVWARLQAMGARADDLDGLRYMSFPEMADLDSPTGGAQLLEAALEVGASLVVVDTATRTVKGEENSNDTWNAWDRYTGVKLKSAGIAFVRLDHSGKDAERGARGASNKATDVDLVWQLAEVGENEFTLTNQKARTPVPEKVIAFRRDTSPRLHSVRISASDVDVTLRAQAAAWTVLDEAAAPWDITRTSARAILKDAGVTLRNEALGRVLAARKAQGNAFATRPEWAPQAAEGALTLVRNDAEGSK